MDRDNDAVVDWDRRSVEAHPWRQRVVEYVLKLRLQPLLRDRNNRFRQRFVILSLFDSVQQPTALRIGEAAHVLGRLSSLCFAVKVQLALVLEPETLRELRFDEILKILSGPSLDVLEEDPIHSEI